MNLDDKFILVLIRQNMFPDKQMVHDFHLGFLIGRAVDGYCQKRHTVTGHPNVLLFGKPSEAGLMEAAEQLRKLGIEFIEWRDPDANPEHDDFGLTGLVSEPISKTLRNKLPRFVQWSANNNVHPFGSLSSEKEHLLDKQEVGGSSPSASSRLVYNPSTGLPEIAEKL